MNPDETTNSSYSLIDIPAHSTQLFEVARDVELRSGLMCVRTAAYLAGFSSQLEARTTLASVCRESKTTLKEWSDKIKQVYAFTREYPPEFAIGVRLEDRIIIQQAPLAADWCQAKLATMRIESSYLCDILSRAPGLGIFNFVLARPDFFLAPMDTLEERRHVDGYDAYMADMADMCRLDPSKCLCELLWSRSKLQHVFVIIGANKKPYLVRRDLGYCAEMTVGVDDIIGQMFVDPTALILPLANEALINANRIEWVRPGHRVEARFLALGHKERAMIGIALMRWVARGYISSSVRAAIEDICCDIIVALESDVVFVPQLAEKCARLCAQLLKTRYAHAWYFDATIATYLNDIIASWCDQERPLRYPSFRLRPHARAVVSIADKLTQVIDYYERVRDKHKMNQHLERRAFFAGTTQCA